MIRIENNERKGKFRIQIFAIYSYDQIFSSILRVLNSFFNKYIIIIVIIKNNTFFSLILS